MHYSSKIAKIFFFLKPTANDQSFLLLYTSSPDICPLLSRKDHDILAFHNGKDHLSFVFSHIIAFFYLWRLEYSKNARHNHHFLCICFSNTLYTTPRCLMAIMTWKSRWSSTRLGCRNVGSQMSRVGRGLFAFIYPWKDCSLKSISRIYLHRWWGINSSENISKHPIYKKVNWVVIKPMRAIITPRSKHIKNFPRLFR